MRVTQKGQVTIPKEVRDRLGIRPGSDVEFVAFADHARVHLSGARDKATARKRRIASALAKYAGKFDTGGMSGKEYVDWLRGPRDDVPPG